MRLVLLPGLHGTDGLFRQLGRELPSWIEPITINYPLDRFPTYEEILPFILERLPDGQFAVLGDSYSGPLALEVARARADRVTAVILSVTFVTNPIRTLLRWVRWFAYTPFVRIAPMQLVSLMLINGVEPRAIHRQIVREVRSVRSSVLAGRLRAAIDCDVRDDLAACSVPILYLKARNDRIIDARALETILSIEPTIEVVELDGPHALLLMCPAEGAREIARFLRGAGLDVAA